MNRLKNEKSPYLQQHANNPVNWYPWGGEALRRARTEDKPILLSIGYSTCHWCHVMARESFEDPEVAKYMNEHFINIKVDREERPDLDGLYMTACEAITGKGGWPLNVFLTPGSKPFYAGTYFPPEPVQRQQSWMQALQFAAYNFYERRKAVEQEAEKILLRMERREKARPVDEEEVFFSQAELQALLERMLEKADRQNGGFGRGAKFPNTMALEFLMQLSWQTSSLPAFQHLLLSIDRMLLGGIHDHLGGGFARYTVDPQWRVPHFEKMLYDNALIAGLLANLQKWRRKPDRLEALHHTLSFMERELQHAEGGFFSALDAETEGEEGRFYTWSYEEVVKQLEEEPGYFCQYYNISKEGNWERGRNILYAVESQKAFAGRKDIPEGELARYLAGCRERLLQLRDRRPRPAVDEMIVLPWNALACTAFARSYAATGLAHYLSVARRCLDFIRQHLQNGGQLLHSNQSAFPAFLDGYAYFIQALLEVHESSQQHELLDEAETWTEKALEAFWDQRAGLFCYQHRDTPDTAQRQYAIREEDMPSPNAVMADNLQRLGLLLGRPEWREQARSMLLAVGENLGRDPLAHASWGTLLVGQTFGVLEIAIAGKDAPAKVREAAAHFFGHHVLIATEEAREDYPLLAHRWPANGETLIYVCRDYTCRKPVREVEEIYLQA